MAICDILGPYSPHNSRIDFISELGHKSATRRTQHIKISACQLKSSYLMYKKKTDVIETRRKQFFLNNMYSKTDSNKNNYLKKKLCSTDWIRTHISSHCITVATLSTTEPSLVLYTHIDFFPGGNLHIVRKLISSFFSNRFPLSISHQQRTKCVRVFLHDAQFQSSRVKVVLLVVKTYFSAWSTYLVIFEHILYHRNSDSSLTLTIHHSYLEVTTLGFYNVE